MTYAATSVARTAYARKLCLTVGLVAYKVAVLHERRRVCGFSERLAQNPAVLAFEVTLDL